MDTLTPPPPFILFYVAAYYCCMIKKNISLSISKISEKNGSIMY